MVFSGLPDCGHLRSYLALNLENGLTAIGFNERKACRRLVWQLPKQRHDDDCQVITAIFLKDTLDAASNDAEHLVVVAWMRLGSNLCFFIKVH